MSIRSVVFDLWGTLIPIDPEPWGRTYDQIARMLGAEPKKFQRAWSRASDERSAGNLAGSLRDACRALAIEVPESTIERALALRRSTLRRTFVPRKEAAPTLRELRRRGYSTGLLTNCDSDVPEVWSRSPLAGLVDAAVFSCRVGLIKPDRRIYLLVAQSLDVDPGECLFVGDGASGELPGAAAAGMRPVLLRSPDTIPPPDWSGEEVASLSDVLSLADWYSA
jgi:putative hydrolase of the HAD superfamily